jgi:hypothetical protein
MHDFGLINRASASLLYRLRRQLRGLCRRILIKLLPDGSAPLTLVSADTKITKARPTKREIRKQHAHRRRRGQQP